MRNDNIEVFLRRVGPRPTRYMEYTLPGQALRFPPQDSQCYVEAIAEEGFQVHVRLHHGFRYFTSTCLEVRLWLDAHEEPDVYLRHKVRIPADGRKNFEYILQDFAVQVDDHWVNGKLCFGEVYIDEKRSRMFRKSELKNRFNKLGTIRVSVQRGHQDAEPVEEEEPESVELDGTVSPDEKRNGITHFVKTTENRRIKAPKSDKSTRFKRIGGNHGERFMFEFRYRSRAELQRLGMIDDVGKRIDPALEGDKDEFLASTDASAAWTETDSLSDLSPLRFPPSQATTEGLQSPFLSQTPASSPLSGYGAQKIRVSANPGPPPAEFFSPHLPISEHRRSKKRLLVSIPQTDNQSSPSTKKRAVLPPIDLTKSTSPTPNHAPAVSAGLNEMSESELKMELRRMEVQKRRYELQQKQLEMQQKQLEYEAQLGKLKAQRQQRIDGAFGAI